MRSGADDVTRVRLIIGAVILLALVGAVWMIRRGGEQSGAAKVTQAVEQQRAGRLAEARSDERAATAVSASISQRVSRADALSTAAVQATIKELRDALDAVPPAVAGDPLPPAPVERLRDQLNASIARANGAANPPDPAG
jgi:hypothetical protein